jgi:hypothetical protein
MANLQNPEHYAELQLDPDNPGEKVKDMSLVSYLKTMCAQLAQSGGHR